MITQTLTYPRPHKGGFCSSTALKSPLRDSGITQPLANALFVERESRTLVALNIFAIIIMYRLMLPILAV